MSVQPAPPLDIGQIVAHALAFKPQKEGAVPVNDIQGAAARLWALLRERQIDFVLVGGIALLQYVAGARSAAG